MALIFCDGFDHYGTDDILKKWDSLYNSPSINTSVKRNGSGSLKLYRSTGTCNVLKILSSNYQLLLFGFACNCTNISSGYPSVKVCDGTTVHVDIHLNESNKVKIYRDTTLLGASENSICTQDEWFYFEAKVYIHDTEGYVTIYKSGELFYELTGIDTRNGANAYINEIEFRTYSTTCYIDDLYIDDADVLGDIKVETLYPSGAGATTQWDASAGDNYACVDETPLNSDTDYVSTATASEIDTYAFGDLATTAGTVYGVQVNMIARKDDAGSRSIAPVVRPASTDRVGTTQSISDSYVDYIQMYAVNPEDSAAWEIADVNGAEFGVKLIE